jgi:hypothetical protein
MKQITITLICSFIFKISFSQINQTKLFFGNYEGIELRYIKSSTDKYNSVDTKNKLWGTKKLTLDSNGTFKIQFPVPWPTTIIGLERFSSGIWTKRNDTLFLNSYYGHKDFMKVKESETTANETQLKVNYESGGKEYFPYLEITINDKTLGIKRPLTKFPLDTVNAIKIKHFVGPNSTDNEWYYKPIKSKSNFFEIWLTNNINGNNFVIENYKLLIRESSLIQIDNVFNLKENCYKSTNFR